MKHIEIPNELIKLKRDNKLEQGDQVIFAAIKKYMNRDTRECFPSITTIAKNLKCSRTKVLSAIDRLCECNLLQKKTGKGVQNTYIFLRSDWDNYFEMFTEDFLRIDMPLNVKEYYMGIQQFLYNKETGVGTCLYSNTILAEKLGISVPSIKKYNAYLIENGFLTEEVTSECDEAGLPIVQKNFNLSSLQQAALWVKAVTEAVQKHEEDIEDLKKKVANLEKELSLYRNTKQTIYNF